MARSRQRKATSRQALNFHDYQRTAKNTDQTGANSADGILVSVLGMCGESGDLATLFKKKLRDGDSFTVYPEQCADELGDILWYLSTVCTKLGFSLEDIARRNLAKTKARWEKFERVASRRPFLDEKFPVHEQFPRTFVITFRESKNGRRPKIALFHNERQCGDTLTDNAHFEDGYRYHDVFHLAYAAVLSWSPITRKILGCKRRSQPRIDEIEDGGRAAVIEEAISALVFQYAEKHNLLDGVGRIDSELLSTITRLTAGLEVREASAGDWEEAILQGYRVFRLLSRHYGGVVTVDLKERTLRFKKL